MISVTVRKTEDLEELDPSDMENYHFRGAYSHEKRLIKLPVLDDEGKAHVVTITGYVMLGHPKTQECC